MQEVDALNEKYFNAVSTGVNALVDTKVAVHKHDKVLDDQIDDFKDRIVSLISSKSRSLTRSFCFQGKIETNIQALQQDNEMMRKILSES